MLRQMCARRISSFRSPGAFKGVAGKNNLLSSSQRLVSKSYSPNESYSHCRNWRLVWNWIRGWHGMFSRAAFGRRLLVGAGTAGGFSLGILGFFEQTEETIQETIILCMKKAILAIQREDLELAEKHLIQAFSHSRRHGLEDAMTQVLDMQANLALSKGELERAENLFKLVVQRLVGQEKVTVTHNSIVEISIKLSEIYLKLGRTTDAITGLQYCIDIQRHKILKAGLEDEDTLLLAGWALDVLTNIYLNEGTASTITDNEKLHQAKALAEEAYNYVVKAVGPEGRQAVTIRNNIATACALLKDYENAFKILQELEGIAREKHEDLFLDIVISIGNMHLEKSEYDKANQVCTEAKSIASKFKDMAAFERAEKCILKSMRLRNSESETEAG